MNTRELIGGLVSLALVGIVILIAHYFTDRGQQSARAALSTERIQEVEAYDLAEKESREFRRKNKNKYQNRALQLRPFDPNTVSEAAMEDMGMPRFLITSLLKYRSSGGRFYQKEDIKKLYVFDPEWYPSYAPYIQIDQSQLSKGKSNYSKKYPKKDYKRKQPDPLNINTCDADELDAQWGVSPKVASNIIKFRDALGGFYDRAQVSEVYTLPDSVYQHNTHWYVEGDVSRININTADYKQLNAHPYIRKYRYAKAIINYRKAHGLYKSLDDLRHIKSIKNQELQKLKPYLTVE